MSSGATDANFSVSQHPHILSSTASITLQNCSSSSPSINNPSSGFQYNSIAENAILNNAANDNSNANHNSSNFISGQQRLPSIVPLPLEFATSLNMNNLDLSSFPIIPVNLNGGGNITIPVMENGQTISISASDLNLASLLGSVEGGNSIAPAVTRTTDLLTDSSLTATGAYSTGQSMATSMTGVPTSLSPGGSTVLAASHDIRQIGLITPVPLNGAIIASLLGLSDVNVTPSSLPLRALTLNSSANNSTGYAINNKDDTDFGGCTSITPTANTAINEVFTNDLNQQDFYAATTSLASSNADSSDIISSLPLNGLAKGKFYEKKAEMIDHRNSLSAAQQSNNNYSANGNAIFSVLANTPLGSPTLAGQMDRLPIIQEATAVFAHLANSQTNGNNESEESNVVVQTDERSITVKHKKKKSRQSFSYVCPRNNDAGASSSKHIASALCPFNNVSTPLQSPSMPPSFNTGHQVAPDVGKEMQRLCKILTSVAEVCPLAFPTDTRRWHWTRVLSCKQLEDLAAYQIILQYCDKTRPNKLSPHVLLKILEDLEALYVQEGNADTLRFNQEKLPIPQNKSTELTEEDFVMTGLVLYDSTVLYGQPNSPTVQASNNKQKIYETDTTECNNDSRSHLLDSDNPHFSSLIKLEKNLCISNGDYGNASKNHATPEEAEDALQCGSYAPLKHILNGCQNNCIKKENLMELSLKKTAVEVVKPPRDSGKNNTYNASSISSVHHLKRSTYHGKETDGAFNHQEASPTNRCEKTISGRKSFHKMNKVDKSLVNVLLHETNKEEQHTNSLTKTNVDDMCAAGNIEKTTLPTLHKSIKKESFKSVITHEHDIVNKDYIPKNATTGSIVQEPYILADKHFRINESSMLIDTPAADRKLFLARELEQTVFPEDYALTPLKKKFDAEGKSDVFDSGKNDGSILSDRASKKTVSRPFFTSSTSTQYRGEIRRSSRVKGRTDKEGGPRKKKDNKTQPPSIHEFETNNRAGGLGGAGLDDRTEVQIAHSLNAGVSSSQNLLNKKTDGISNCRYEEQTVTLQGDNGKWKVNKVIPSQFNCDERERLMYEAWALAWPLLYKLRRKCPRNLMIKWNRERTNVGGSFIVTKGVGYNFRFVPTELTPAAVSEAFRQAVLQREATYGSMNLVLPLSEDDFVCDVTEQMDEMGMRCAAEAIMEMDKKRGKREGCDVCVAWDETHRAFFIIPEDPSNLSESMKRYLGECRFFHPDVNCWNAKGLLDAFWEASNYRDWLACFA